MKVLVACEESQTVCKAFRARGHEAYSCDIQEPSGGHPEWHIKGDVLPLLNGNCNFITEGGVYGVIEGRWDLIIAHPPCTDLAVSGARWFPEKQKDMRQQKSVVFFMQCILADCDRIAVENPIGIMSSVFRKPSQVIQPYEYGHPTRKATCLWLKNLPPLKPTKIIHYTVVKTGHGTDSPWHAYTWNLPPAERARARSKTFPGIANAMAEQWGYLTDVQTSLFE